MLRRIAASILICGTVAVGRPVPTPQQLQWHQTEIACFIHYNIATMVGTQGCSSRDPPDILAWAPVALDTDQWIATGKALGCVRFIYVAKHACGFAAWRSNVTGYNYSVAYAPAPYNGPQFDVVDRFVASAKAAGVAYGFYYTVVTNAYCNVEGGVVGPDPQPNQLNVTQEQYDMFVVAHLMELWGRFGPLAEVWFDGGYQPQLAPALQQMFAVLQPNVVAFQGFGLMPSPVRWIGTESGFAPDPCWSTADDYGAGDPDAPYWYPAEVDFTLQSGDQWFYNPTSGVHSPAELRAMYENSVGHNGAIIVDIAPMPNGTVPQEQVAAATALGQYITQCYTAAPVANTSGSGLVFTLSVPNGPQTIDRIVIQEDQSNGQVIRAYVVTGTLANGATILLSNGTSVGNKKIDVLATPSSVVKVQLNITSAVDVPKLRGFAVRSCNSMAAELDATWNATHGESERSRSSVDTHVAPQWRTTKRAAARGTN